MINATKATILYLFLFVVISSCSNTKEETTDTSLAPPYDDWTLYQTTTGSSNEEALSYFAVLRDTPANAGGVLRHVSLSSGQITFGEDIAPSITITGQDITLEWSDTSAVEAVTCTGKINSDSMSGDFIIQKPYSSSSGTWRAIKGLDDVENGSYVRYLDSGRTQIYFRAWTKNASRVYLTGSFISGSVNLVKCGQTVLKMDIWNISNTADCSSESYYEFTSQTSPITVDVHIVSSSGEIVRTKTITYGSDVAGS